MIDSILPYTIQRDAKQIFVKVMEQILGPQVTMLHLEIERMITSSMICPSPHMLIQRVKILTVKEIMIHLVRNLRKCVQMN